MLTHWFAAMKASSFATPGAKRTHEEVATAMEMETDTPLNHVASPSDTNKAGAESEEPQPLVDESAAEDSSLTSLLIRNRTLNAQVSRYVSGEPGLSYVDLQIELLKDKVDTAEQIASSERAACLQVPSVIPFR